MEEKLRLGEIELDQVVNTIDKSFSSLTLADVRRMRMSLRFITPALLWKI